MFQGATLKGLRWSSADSQLLQSCKDSPAAFETQGFKANPGLELANAFRVTTMTDVAAASIPRPAAENQ